MLFPGYSWDIQMSLFKIYWRRYPLDIPNRYRLEFIMKFIMSLSRKIKRRLSVRRLFCSFFRSMAKAIRNLSVFNKINLIFLIRNISLQKFHSALGKISVVNIMYNLLGLKNYYGLKIQIQNFVLVFLGDYRHGRVGRMPCQIYESYYQKCANASAVKVR